MNVSKCCKAKAVVEGTAEWYEEGFYDLIGTNYYMCEECGEACDIVAVPEAVIKGLQEAKEGKIFTDIDSLHSYLSNKKNWNYLDWIEHWWHIYFWNYVSDIPLRVKSFFQRGARGYADSDTWDFDRYLTDVIEGGVKHLIKYNMRDDKKYVEDLRIIVKTMKLSRDINECSKKYASKENWQKAQKEFRKGMNVLIKRWWQLWD